MRILHAADLHLSRDEAEYGFAVLDELLEAARREKVEAVLLAGDLFDSYADMEALRAPFRERIERLARSSTVVAIAGNHEQLGAGRAGRDRLDLGVPLAAERPYESLDLAPDVEVLRLPYGTDVSDYLSWPKPRRKRGVRLALAHGTVAGLGLAGPLDEKDAAAIDPDLFAWLEVDYAALGHIHAGRIERRGSVLLAYPGSARVWRRGEEGPRCALLVEISERGIVPRPVALESAGQYRSIARALGLDGTCPDLSAEAASWGRSDWIELRLTGLVEDEGAVAELERELRARFADRVRRFELLREDILVLEGIASQPIARRFLELWAAREPSAAQGAEARAVWRLAREVGLRKIKELLEARR